MHLLHDHAARQNIQDEAHAPGRVVGDEPIHAWFELTYAQYLTIPRSILEAMPQEWQARFVRCLEELDEAFDWRPSEGRYWVQLKDADGRYVEDPLREYRHPNRAYIAGLVRPLPDVALGAEVGGDDGAA